MTSASRARGIAAEYGARTGPVADFAAGTRPLRDDEVRPLIAALDADWEAAVDAENREAARELMRVILYVELEGRRRGLTS
jgi:hypothetical protein